MTQNIKKKAARLASVQALYQASQNKQPVQSLIDEYLKHRVSMEIDGEEVAQMDGVLFKKIVEGVYERGVDLEKAVEEKYNKNNKIEPLLKSILLCAAYEMSAHEDIDAPIIINDYLDVAHSYYGQSEVGLINGILDKFQSFRA